MRGENIVADTNYFGNILDRIATEHIEKTASVSAPTIVNLLNKVKTIESIKLSSKTELTKLGYKALGLGIYKDSTHHLWTLKREGDGYCLERSEEEENIRKAKEIKTANKKSHTIQADYEQKPSYGPAVFKETEGDWTVKVQKNKDWDVWTARWFHKEKGEDEAKSSEADTKEEVIANAKHELKRLRDGVVFSFSGNRISSKVTIKSDSPIQPFLNDLSQRGIYYQKLSETTEDNKHLAILDVDDSEKTELMAMASDSGIVVEAKQLISAQEAWDMSPRRFRYKLVDGLAENVDRYIEKKFEDIPKEIQIGITENYSKLGKTGSITADIEEQHDKSKIGARFGFDKTVKEFEEGKITKEQLKEYKTYPSRIHPLIDKLSKEGVEYFKTLRKPKHEDELLSFEDGYRHGVLTAIKYLIERQLTAKKAEIPESRKVFSDEAVYSAIKHYLNMGFNVKDSIDNFMKSYNLDKEHEESVKELVKKYNLK